jgi:Protein of unknown function (DUF3180)
VTPVKRRDLVVLALGLALAAWLLVRALYGDLPGLDWWLPTPLAVLAAAEALGARVVGQRLRSLRAARSAARGGAGPAPTGPVRPLEPMVVARVAVLAQASAYVGAVFVGIWAGVLAYVGPASGRLQAAGPDAVTAIIGVVSAAGLVAAALWLESVCRIPPGPDDEEGPLAPST